MSTLLFRLYYALAVGSMLYTCITLHYAEWIYYFIGRQAKFLNILKLKIKV